MDKYSPPIQDILFALKHIADIEDLMKLDAYTEMPFDELEGLLEEAGRFVTNEIVPTNRIGDIEGAQLNDDHSVKLPESFHKAYKEYVKAGWGSVSLNPEWGGGGLPNILGIVLAEMLTAGNMAFSLGPLLTHGSINALEAHGSQELQAAWLPKLISGEWTGTMNLTEPHAGSDVGALNAKAERGEDGHFLISGQKIFITYGEHNLTENIVHLVLARITDAPPGTRGISLFLVPKFLLNEYGSIGEKNGVSCLSLEKKMGIHASPTCMLEYESAQGYLIGEENEGMKCMFTMMNSARLGVGNSGLAMGERVFQETLAYAQERLQGRRPETEKGKQSPIIEHPDVKRTLLQMKSLIEAMRCLIYYNASLVDKTRSSNPEQQILSDEMASILTPLSKAWCSDIGTEIASLGIQIHGGAGYIEETGMAQHYRDIRIAAIYEGTNGIQAMDLVARKLPIRNGEAIEELFSEIEGIKDELDGDLTDLVEPISAALESARDATKFLLTNLVEGEIDSTLAGATPYLELLSKLVAGWLMARSANIAKQENYPQDFVDAKTATARFFCHQMLPTGTALHSSITAGDEILATYKF